MTTVHGVLIFATSFFPIVVVFCSVLIVHFCLFFFFRCIQLVVLIVTCIQFNPVSDEYFISGSLDAKVRIWSVSGRRVVDWTDLHEMVTATCYTPDGQVLIIFQVDLAFSLVQSSS